jgi:hypothetical protein
MNGTDVAGDVQMGAERGFALCDVFHCDLQGREWERGCDVQAKSCYF